MLADLRFSARSLRKSPLFTTVVVLSLAIGIGAVSTVFSWLNFVLFDPLPGVRNQGELAVLVSNEGGGNVSLPDLRDAGNLNAVISGGLASQLSPASLRIDNRTDWIHAQLVTANYFELLGVKASLGRTFLKDEDQKPGGNPVLVISETLWRRSLAADPDIIGKSIQLNRHSFTIIGVVPSRFAGTMTGLRFDAWAPVSMCQEISNSGELERRNARGWHNLVRLQPGISIDRAQMAIDVFDSQLAATYPHTNRTTKHHLVPLSRCPYGAQPVLLPALALLLAVSAFTLVIVSANVSNLLLARATARQRELAVRLAVGARRSQLLRLLLSESLLLAILGGAGGFLITGWAVNVLGWFIPSSGLPVNLQGFTPGLPVYLVVAGIALLTGLAVGLLPALRASNASLSAAMKDNSRSATGGAEHNRLRSALVITEIALSIVLLISATLCLKGFQRASTLKPGFEPEGVLIARLHVGMNGYNQTTGLSLYKVLEQNLSAVPGFETVSFTTWYPLGLEGCKGSDFQVPSYQPRPGENPTVEYSRISGSFLQTLHIPLVEGRTFTDNDDETSPPVAIINEALAAKFWPGQNPVGRIFKSLGVTKTVIGVVKTVKAYRLDEAPRPYYYVPYRQGVPDLDLGLCIRTKGGPAGYTDALAAEIHKIDPGLDVRGAMPMSVFVQSATLGIRMVSTLVTSMGIVALLLAGMGLYAVMAYSVQQRTRELGIRIAMGASSAQILREVVLKGLKLTGIGIALGLVIAFSVTRLLAGFLYNVSPFDPVAYLGAPLFVLIISILATWLPARRAARTDPLEALRAE